MSALARLAALRSLPRDKADTLLLLVTCALILLPHAGQLPAWGAPACAVLLLWRGWITWSGRRMPPRALMVGLTLLVIAATLLSYRTILGQQAGVSLLVLLLAVKLLEMHARRDLYVVLYLGLFLLLASFFHSQSIGMALYAGVVVILLLTTQLSFQYAGNVPPLRRRLGLALRMAGLAIPLMLVLFLLFPRIQGPLWSLPRDAGAGRSGLSDSMAPGNLSNLALSDDIAFRARFRDAPPPQAQLYWRGIVLGRYDGRTWTPLPASAWRGDIAIELRGAPVRYEITMEPSGRPWLFALDLPAAAPSLADRPTRLTEDLQVVGGAPLNERVRFEAVSYPGYTLQPALPPMVLRQWLALPADYNPRTRRFAAELRARHADDDALLRAVLAHFRQEDFHYTLKPPLLGRDAIDEFLFSTRRGFCEHYAGAFVFLMRAAGIPARVVTGYQGGKVNPVDGYMAVRQSDAHAWAEVWMPGRGWLRVDPTAAVAPERVERDLAAAVPQPLFGGLVNFDAAQSPLLNSLRFRWDAITNGWNQWVLNYSADKQLALLRGLGFARPDMQTLSLVLIAMVALVAAAVGLPLLRDRQRTDPVLACYRAFCEAMARAGLPRLAHEGPRAYGLRLLAAGSPLPPARKIAVERFLRLYENMQYGRTDRQARAHALPDLKNLLSACR